MNQAFQRRTDKEKHQSGDYYTGPDRYYDQITERTIIKVYSGGCYTTDTKGEMMVTILGSCIACCIHDPMLNLGGMNHFLVPGEELATGSSTPRHGVHAMELLINGLIKLGASKSRMQAKIFGGAALLQASTAQIGAKNIAFVKRFLSNENIPIIAEDVGGNFPRRLHYHPDTGKAMLRKLQRQDDLKIVEKEKQYIDSLQKTKQDESDDVTLF